MGVSQHKDSASCQGWWLQGCVRSLKLTALHASTLEFYCIVSLLFRKGSWTTEDPSQMLCLKADIPFWLHSPLNLIFKPLFSPAPLPSLINKVRHTSVSLTWHWLLTKLGATHWHPHFQKENKLAPTHPITFLVENCHSSPTYILNALILLHSAFSSHFFLNQLQTQENNCLPFSYLSRT